MTPTAGVSHWGKVGEVGEGVPTNDGVHGSRDAADLGVSWMRAVRKGAETHRVTKVEETNGETAEDDGKVEP